jgi:predicted alpha/beta hydrolase family esterase
MESGDRFMTDRVLIVPGFHGSGAVHWQTWLENNLPEAHRVEGIDWESPVLPEWSAAIHRNLDRFDGRVWIVAHSFGCLASSVVASERSEKVAGVIFVAPADPERFSPEGVRDQTVDSAVSDLLPASLIEAVPSIVVASENDPWLDFNKARLWAKRWGSQLVNIGKAGHINTESGFGPWPYIVELLADLQQSVKSKSLEADISVKGVIKSHNFHGNRSGLIWNLLQFTC